MNSLSKKAHFLHRFVRLLQNRKLSDPSTFHQAKRMIGDTVGVAYSGVNTPTFQSALKTKNELFGEGPFSIWGTSETANLPGAVFFNALSVSSTDFDEGHRKAVGHPGSVVVPVALILGQKLKKPYADLLKAVIIGYEAGTRFSYSRYSGKVNSYATGRWGAIASATTAACLLELNIEQLMHALSLAFVLSPAMQGGSTDVSTGSMSKEGVAWAVQSGLQSALLAQKGFSGPYLFIDAYNDLDKNKLLADEQSEWLINSNYFKPYACCRWLHTALYLAIKLKKEHNVRVENIDRIEICVFERALKLIEHKYPENVVQAQFHLPFTLACALLFDEVTPRQVTELNLQNDKIKKLIDKISLIADASFSKVFPFKLKSQVTFFLKNGTQVSLFENSAPWNAEMPPTDEELYLKFALQTGSKAQRLWDSIFENHSAFNDID